MKKRKDNKKKSSNKLKIMLFVLMIVLITFTITKVVYDGYSILEVRRIPIKVVVSESVGVGFDENALLFGGVSPGSESNREVVISNNHYDPLKVFISFRGDAGEWCQTYENRFFIYPDEIKRVGFLLKVPDNTKDGEYNGEVLVTFKRGN